MFLVICMPIVFGSEELSTGQFLSGDMIEIDSHIYTVLVSNSTNSVMLRDTNNNGIFLDFGQCYKKNEFEICVELFDTTNSGQKFVQMTTYLITAQMNISRTISENETYVGEKIRITYEMIGDADEDLTKAYLETYIPKTFTIVQTSCDKTSQTDGTLLYIRRNELKKDTTFSCYVDLTSSKPRNHTFSGTYEYTHLNTKTKGTTDSFNINFKSHIDRDYVFYDINNTKPFRFNVTLNNLVDETVDISKFKIYFPQEIVIERTPSKFIKSVSSTIENQIYQAFEREDSLKGEENETFSFELQTDYEINSSLFTLLEYKVGNLVVNEELERIDFNISFTDTNISTTNQTITLCSGDDFNITISQNLTNYSVYAGNSFSTRVYAQNGVDENITWANIAIKKGDELFYQGSKTFFKKQKYNLFTLQKTIPYTYTESSYDFEVIVDYYCQDTGVEYSQTETLSIPTSTFDDIVLSKNIEKTEITSNEEILVNVTIENPSVAEFYGLRVREEIPDNLSVRGITSRTLFLNPDTSEQVYTYYITAPEVNESTTFTIKTIMDVPVENDTLSFEQENIITVEPDYNITMKLSETIPSGKKYLYEPITISYVIENNESDKTARNILFEITESKDFDSTLYEESIDLLGPGEKYTFDVTILPKKTNATIASQVSFKNINYGNQKISSEEDISVSGARITQPFLSYIIDEIEDDNTNKSTVTFTFINPTTKNISARYYDGDKFKNIFIDGDDQTEITLEFDRVPETFSRNTSLVAYSFLGNTFFTIPESRTYLYIEPELPEINSNITNSSDDDEFETTNLQLEEQEQSIIGIVLISLFALVLLGGGAIGTFIYIHKRQDKAEISQEDIDKAEHLEVKETHVMEKSEPVNDKKNKNDAKKEIPIEDKRIEPTNIFSFDDYEELKKQLDEKDKKHKKK